MYNWITLLYNGNYHNIVNQLYPDIKLKVKKNCGRQIHKMIVPKIGPCTKLWEPWNT